jgi:hypothetical protein
MSTRAKLINFARVLMAMLFSERHHGSSFVTPTDIVLPM